MASRLATNSAGVATHVRLAAAAPQTRPKARRVAQGFMASYFFTGCRTDSRKYRFRPIYRELTTPRTRRVVNSFDSWLTRALSKGAN